MAKYMVYSEWDEGRGTDYQFFPTLRDAREFSRLEVGPDGSADRCYIEYIEDEHAEYYEVEVGATTTDIFER